MWSRICGSCWRTFGASRTRVRARGRPRSSSQSGTHFANGVDDCKPSSDKMVGEIGEFVGGYATPKDSWQGQDRRVAQRTLVASYRCLGGR